MASTNGNTTAPSNGTVDPRLVRLREAMGKADGGKGVSAYIIPTEDPHMSEYPPDTFKRREYISRWVQLLGGWLGQGVSEGVSGVDGCCSQMAGCLSSVRCTLFCGQCSMQQDSMRVHTWPGLKECPILPPHTHPHQPKQLHRLSRHSAGHHGQGAAVDRWALLPAGRD